jgi:hypothetical protein
MGRKGIQSQEIQADKHDLWSINTYQGHSSFTATTDTKQHHSHKTILYQLPMIIPVNLQLLFGFNFTCLLPNQSENRMYPYQLNLLSSFIHSHERRPGSSYTYNENFSIYKFVPSFSTSFDKVLHWFTLSQSVDVVQVNAWPFGCDLASCF